LIAYFAHVLFRELRGGARVPAAMTSGKVAAFAGLGVDHTQHDFGITAH
jgi:hypothetical protein